MKTEKHHFSRRLRVGMVTALFLGFAVCTAPFAQTQALSKRIALVPTGPQATLAYVEGTVMVNGIASDIGALIPDKAQVTTGPDSLAEIVFEGKNAIRLGAKATAILELGALQKTVTLKAGAFTAVLHKLDRIDGGGLTLRTPTAVGGVRGTSFFANVEAETGKTYVCICDGRIQLSDDSAANSFEKAAAHHDGEYFTKGPNGVEETPAGLEMHSDSDVESLAARVGEKIDWGTIESYN